MDTASTDNRLNRSLSDLIKYFDYIKKLGPNYFRQSCNASEKFKKASIRALEKNDFIEVWGRIHLLYLDWGWMGYLFNTEAAQSSFLLWISSVSVTFAEEIPNGKLYYLCSLKASMGVYLCSLKINGRV